jgi:dolichol-phosphate mannosyltransferase
VRVVRLRRNFGKAAALAAGFSQARGEIVVTIDADLQDDPAEIPRLLVKLDEGFDLVSGWKTRRRDPLRRRVLSRIFNWVTGRMSGLRLHDMNCGLKAYRAEVVRGMPLYGELHRFIPCSRSTAAFGSPSCPSTIARASTVARATASSATSAGSWIC